MRFSAPLLQRLILQHPQTQGVIILHHWTKEGQERERRRKGGGKLQVATKKEKKVRVTGLKNMLNCMKEEGVKNAGQRGK